MFFADRRCKRYNCTCYCTGKYACMTGSPINICDEDGNVIESAKTSGTVETTHTESNRRRTGGTGSTSSRTTVIDNSTGGRTGTGTSTSRQTTRTQGTQTVTTYYETFESRQGSSVTRRNGEDVRAGRCGPCIINSQSFPGRREFQLDDECKRFQCNCKCDGSWLCPRQKPMRICGSSTSTSTGSSQTVSRTTYYEYEVRQGRSEVMLSRDEIEAGGCGICVISNQPYRGGVEFHYLDGCKRFRCVCSCDGSWNCPRQIPTWGCQGGTMGDSQETSGSRTTGTETSGSETSETRTSGSRTVSTQTSGSRVGDSSVTSSSSSGSFERTISRSGHSSGGRGTSGSRSGSTSVDSVSSLSTSSSSSSSSSSSVSSSSQLFYYEYEERQGTSEVRWNTERQECGVCEVAGTRYDGGSNFRYNDGCKGFNCTCNCDGSWLCPSQKPRILCPDQCKSCIVRDEIHAFNSRFLVEYDECRSYMCTCHCNGRFTCLPGDEVNTCEEGVPDQDGGDEQDVACTTCVVNDEVRQPDTRFQYQIGCMRYVCTCDCTGHHECSEENVCSGEERPDGCRECVINGTRFPANSPFQYVEGCYRFNCDCACDGSYDCPSRDTEYVCDGGCQQCVVNGRLFRGGSPFQYEDGCFIYSCSCNCDGSYNCPPERTVNTCTTPKNCKKCHVNEESYDPDTFFQYDEGCLRFSCDCFCNGSHICPASRTENMCGAAVGSGPCTQCVINGTVQQPNTDFYHTNDCVRYRCHCGCNGAWDCQFESTIPNCRGSVQAIRHNRKQGRKRCRACVVDNRRYRPNSRFQYTKGCDRFECSCGCDGSYNCPAGLTRNVCGGDTNCKDCRVRGTKYSGNSVFVLRERCLQYRCFCSCNGEWDCPADRAIDTCTGRG